MEDRSDWIRFFRAHAPVYEQNAFTQNTVAEVDFLVEELGLSLGTSVLDVGCGTGRHSIELARRGYSMTGLDLSPEMLARAKANAEAAGVLVRWVQADATAFDLLERFDAAICLCEGAFGLLGSGEDPVEHPLAIARNVSRCLKPGAKAVFTMLNGSRFFRMHQNADVASGSFDPVALAQSSEVEVEGGGTVTVRERAFVPTEIGLIFRLAGLRVLDVWGGTAGNWGRRPIDLDEIEFMVVAEKAPDA